MRMTSVKRKLSEPRSVSKSLFELKAKGTLCDVELRLKGSTMLAHACVLASGSSFFFELFQLNQNIHWCAKNPLVIDLESLKDNSTDLCTSCVWKILDFIYLRELVIGQDHYEHFVAINDLLHIFDSMPLGKNGKRANFCKPVQVKPLKREQLSDRTKLVREDKNSVAELLSEQDSQSGSEVSSTVQNPSTKPGVVYLSTGTISVDNSLSEKVIHSGPSDINVSSKCSLTDKLIGTVISRDDKSSESKSLPVTINCVSNSDSTESSTSVLKSSLLDEKGSKKTEKAKSCEFMCCNLEPDINSSQAKVRKRRKMFCEACNFSSSCVRKVFQHLQSTDHLRRSCPICLRKIEDINELKEHLKDHANSKPFICQICNKRNRYWDFHKMHLKIHCRNKQFYCDLCHRGFVSKRSLTEHLTTHKGSYLCEKCDYFTSDLNMYQSHLLEHGKDVSLSDLKSNFHSDIDLKLAKQKIRKFQCQVCHEGFTQKKNLVRHVKLKHFDATQYKCSMCDFTSTRTDILSNHMKKKHNCSLVKDNKKCLERKNLKKDNKKSSDFVSVLIPIQIVPENSIVNTIAPEVDAADLTKAVDTTGITDETSSFSNAHVILHQHSNVQLFVEGKVTIDRLDKCEEKNASLSSDLLDDNRTSKKESESSRVDSSETDPNYGTTSNNANSKIQVRPNYISGSNSLNMTIDSSEDKLTNPQTLDDVNLGRVHDGCVIDRHKDITEGNKYIWLNETTGELLYDEKFVSMHAFKANQVSGTDNSALDFCDQLKSSLLNEASGVCSNIDLRDDNEEWQYPQTPQASMVGIDECDNLFPWNQIDNSFYSTWVLNETTGELNMVSFFSIPSELKLGENSNSLESFEDDDTALFLNEGTGDLSVIYFNPNGLERSNLNMQPCERTNHDNLETLSEVSDEDSDFLNEEFRRVSANFMSNEENEKFLNELTGEFDIAKLNNSQPDLLNNVAGNELYLNEETGEISVNVADNNVENDLFSKPDMLEYDLDDSLNCEDFESFFSDVKSFPSQFCLEGTSNNWHSGNEAEASDALVLNECTGELVMRR